MTKAFLRENSCQLECSRERVDGYDTSKLRADYPDKYSIYLVEISKYPNDKNEKIIHIGTYDNFQTMTMRGRREVKRKEDVFYTRLECLQVTIYWCEGN